jgi:hypothetical protein
VVEEGFEPSATRLSAEALAIRALYHRWLVGAPAPIRTGECQCVGLVPWAAGRRERELVRAARFELAEDPGFRPGASSGSATPARWCPLIDSNDHDTSRRCLKPLRLPIPPRGQVKAIVRATVKRWCARRDLNPHGVTRRSLSAMRLPVPPRALGPSLGFEPSSAPYRGAASPQCFEGR